MASTNQTANYQLCQWAADDQVLREDFNADNLKVDTALAALALQSTIVFGSYTGDGTDNRQITLGFRPAAVLILPYGGTYMNGYILNLALVLDGVPAQNVTISDTGFLVSAALNYSTDNRSPYRYMAFR